MPRVEAHNDSWHASAEAEYTRMRPGQPKPRTSINDKYYQHRFMMKNSKFNEVTTKRGSSSLSRVKKRILATAVALVAGVLLSPAQDSPLPRKPSGSTTTSRMTSPRPALAETNCNHGFVAASDSRNFAGVTATMLFDLAQTRSTSSLGNYTAKDESGKLNTNVNRLPTAEKDRRRGQNGNKAVRTNP